MWFKKWVYESPRFMQVQRNTFKNSYGNKDLLGQIMAWTQTGDKLLSEPMMILFNCWFHTILDHVTAMQYLQNLREHIYKIILSPVQHRCIRWNKVFDFKIKYSHVIQLQSPTLLALCKETLPVTAGFLLQRASSTYYTSMLCHHESTTYFCSLTTNWTYELNSNKDQYIYIII